VTYPETKVTNTADDWAMVGAQAQVIHGGVHNSYYVPPGATAKEKYEVGIRYLNSGVPSLALQWIGRAIAERHDTSEVRFYWLLALLSGRTSRQLSSEDVSQLRALENNPVVQQLDPWSDGIRAVLRLLNAIRSPDADPGPSIDALEHLHPAQKKSVFRHIAVFLKGPKGDQIWQNAAEAAMTGRYSNRRDKRAKYFFYRDPVQAYPRQVMSAMVSLRDRLAAIAASAIFALTLLDIAGVLVTHVSIAGLVGLLIGCGGLCIAAANWTEFRWQRQRRAEHQRLLIPDTNTTPQTHSRLTTGIGHQLDWFLRKYAPNTADISSWLSVTQGIRDRLRDEFAEIYRDKRVTVAQLNWLVVYEVRQLAKRWNQGRLYEIPDDASRLSPKALWAGIAATALGGVLAVPSLLGAAPVGGFIALVILGISGYQGARRWTDIALEMRRAAADKAESERKYAERRAAYGTYRTKFDALQPSDVLMAEWLECDKKVILNLALEYFSLRRSDVISHAFLETPSVPYERASDRDGPWRYSRYKIIVFLLTADGIRQASYELRTRDGDIKQRDDRSYGYDKIASVEASLAKDGNRQEFKVHLVDGKTIPFHVAAALTESNGEDGSFEDPSGETDVEALSSATLDATGMRNTLRILRGVAADGKAWITRESK
jgi:hypothetical protein